MTKVVVTFLILFLLIGTISGPGPSASAGNGVEVQLCIILDGSVSIEPEEWTLMIEGLAAAIEDPGCTPHDGSLELTIVLFGWDPNWHAEVALLPTVITSTEHAGTVAATVRGTAQPPYGATPMACGILLAADTLVASPNFDPGIKQVLNLATDGEPNICCNIGGGYVGYGCGIADPPPPAAAESAVEARNYAIATLEMTPSQDEFDAEFVGAPGIYSDWLRDEIAWPQPGYYAPPFNGAGCVW